MPPNDVASAEPSTSRTVAKIIFTSTSGLLYFTVPTAGGKNLKILIGSDSAEVNNLVYFLSATSTVVYSLFLYNKLGFFSLYINTLPKIATSFLAIFAASSYYTAGNTGARELEFSENAGKIIGILNYVVRVGVLTDTAEKFPAFMIQFKTLIGGAIDKRHYAELLRVSVALFSCLIFAASITDASYSMGQSVAEAMGLETNIASALGNVVGVLAAFGIMPIIGMSNYKGIRELTFADPSSGLNVKTDRYTFIAFFLTWIAAMGTLGAIFNSSGAMFARMPGSMYLRVSEAILATVTGSTPGMAVPLRRVSGVMGVCVENLRLRFFPAATSANEPTLVQVNSPTPSPQG